MALNKDFQNDWFVFRRIQDVTAARRINLVRVVAVAVFYAVVLSNHLSTPTPTPEDAAYLWSSSRICGAWMFLGLAIAIALRLRAFPPWAAYLTAFCDSLLLTSVAARGQQADSFLVVGYFVIIAASYLRFSFQLIVFTTSVTILGYLTLVYNTPHYWTRPAGAGFPYLTMSRVVAGMLVMGFVGWHLCTSCKQTLKLSIEANLAESKA